MARNGSLSPTQRRAIATLMTERDVRAAAQAAKIAERTIWRWLSDPDFRAELSRQEGQLIDAATRGLLALQGQALAVLEAVLLDDYQKAGDRLRAAEAVLDYSIKLRALNSLEARILALEEGARER